MRRLLLSLTLIAALSGPGQALAGEVISTDDQGREIHLDVQVEGVDAEWFAALLRTTPHGDEISALRVQIVTPRDLAVACGISAAGCYSRNTMVVTPEQSEENAHTVVHEYGHHLDASTPVAGAIEPNGTSTWWRARGMAQLLRYGSVARNYSKGWDRSIGEIFAEDYAQLVRGDGQYGITWLDPPDETILAALRFDLGLGPEPVITAPPAIKPLTISQRGRLAPRRSSTIRFGLLGPGRRVQATATFAGATEKGARARLEVRCNGARVALKTIVSGRTSVSVDQPNLGPAAECTATLTSASRTIRAYTLVVRLSIDQRA